MVYIFLLLDMQSGHITTKAVGLNHASAPVYSTLLQNFIRFNYFLARKWDPNQLQTVRYQVLLSVYMSHCLSRLYLKTKHFCLQIWYWGNERVPPWFCHYLRCFKSTNTPLSSENIYILNTKILWPSTWYCSQWRRYHWRNDALAFTNKSANKNIVTSCSKTTNKPLY